MAYNGWKNYETWNVALWIDNEEGSSLYWNEAAQECFDEAKDQDDDEPKRTAAGLLADRLKTEFEDAQPDLGASMWADLLGAALSEVDWYEIAEHYLNDIADEVAA